MTLNARRHKGYALCVSTRLWFVPLLVSLACLPAWAVRVDYTLTVRANADRVHVTVLVRDDPDTAVTLAMPVWIPGYYRRLDQWKGVSNVIFTANGQALTTEHRTPSTWTATHTSNQPLTMDYDVKRWEYGFGVEQTDSTLGQMGVHLDRESAFIHPGAACMYVDGHKDAPCTLTLNLPRKWDATAPLPRDANGAFMTTDYDVLNDSPIQAGRFHRVSFTARGHVFDVITTGKCKVSDEALTLVCKSLAEAATDLFEGWTPYGTYQFHFHFPPKREYPGAGLEHRLSCVIVFGSNTTDDDFVHRGAQIVSHEFLHAWNVKALKPTGLGPFDYQNEVKTPSLWMAEGLTDYYAYIVGVRAGLWTPEAALKRFSGVAEEYRGSSGRNKTSLVNSSTNVWKAESTSSSGSGGTSYYTKGLLAAWLLDIQIRAATSNRKSLDDALRWLIRKYGTPGTGYSPDTLRAAIREATGVDASDSYNAYVHGTDDLPFEKALAPAGILVKAALVPDLMLGANLEKGGREPKVISVQPGSAAGDAHIEPGDVLVQIDGKPVRVDRRGLLAGKERNIGDRVPVAVRREDEIQTITVIVKGRQTFELALDPNATLNQKALWKGLWASDRFASRP